MIMKGYRYGKEEQKAIMENNGVFWADFRYDARNQWMCRKEQ